MTRRSSARSRPRRPVGQATVEFALTIPIFLVILVAVFDLGRAVYLYNGVSQAAREIARATSVHPGLVLGMSPESEAVIATQRGLVPGLAAPTFTCADLGSTASNGNSPCRSGDFVRVRVTAGYDPVILLGLAGPIQLSAESSLQIP